jgi:hypothetical protein
MVGGGLGVTAQDQSAPIGGRKLNVEHLDSGKFIQHCTSRKSTRHTAQPRPQRDLQAVGHESDKDVRFDAMFKLMMDGAQGKIVFEVFKSRLDLDQLDVKLPELSRFSAGDIAAQ